MTRARMIGRSCPDGGPGGRDCPCCGQPPGIERRRKRRSVKRSERNQVRNAIRKGEEQ